MSTDWDEVAEDVVAAIEDEGFAATLLRPGANTGPESNPTIGDPIQVPVKVIKVSLDRLRRAGTLVEGSKAAYLVAAGALTQAPSTVDKLRVSGKDRTILASNEVGPGGVDVLYTLQVAA